MGLWPGAVEGVVLIMADEAFWAGRRVLITGHTGFKGSWLSLWLRSMGAEVTGLALDPPTETSLFDAARLADDMASTIADVRDRSAVFEVITDASPEIVIHMAAQPLVRASYDDPLGTYATNVMGTAHVLDAIRHTPDVRVVVNVTTDKCYENREWHWGYREDEALGGHDPYSSSKACSELVTSAYRRSFFSGPDCPRLASARAGNVIGGGDWAVDRLVPDALASFERGTAVVLRNPRAIRPWQHVLEPLSGYLLLAERLWEDAATAGAWNFGPWDADARPVSWVVDQLSRLWPGSPGWAMSVGEHPHEAQYLKLDTSRARAELGWAPTWNLRRSLEMIVNWHRGWLSGEPAADLCLSQIHTFTQDRRDGSPHV